MAFEVKTILDSIGPNGKRLTTLTATYPRFIHAEIMTHRDRARNAASSRAIPWSKMRQMIMEDPVIPLVFGSEQKGMKTGDEVDDPALAKSYWLGARANALVIADALAAIGVHKSLVNRVVEPWMWITTLMTATEWNNFFRQRCHEDAEIHFQKIAGMIRDALASSKPRGLHAGAWHLPFTPDLRAIRDRFGMNEEGLEAAKRISTARCARVSYLTHEGTPDMDKDLALFEKLYNGSGFGHWSPMEHVAEALPMPKPGQSFERSGPFVGWRQFRKQFGTLENVEG